MYKRLRKIISIFLAGIILTTSMPQTVYAKETECFDAVATTERDLAITAEQTWDDSTTTEIANGIVTLNDESDIDDTQLYPEPIGEPVVVTEQGNGTKAKPYKISSEEEFALIAKDPDAHYILASDLVISNNYEIDFSGEFDGNHHSITLYDDALFGLFSKNSGLIKNINIKEYGEMEIQIGSLDYSSCSIGSICSVNEGFVRDCTVTGTLNIICIGTGAVLSVGGIVGKNTNKGEIKGCWNDALLNIYNDSPSHRGTRVLELYVGGISGYNYGQISCCLNTGNIWSKFTEDQLLSDAVNYFYFYSGGITGRVYDGIFIENCIQAGAEIDLDCELIGYSSGSSYYFFRGPLYDLETGFVVAGEYNFGTHADLDLSNIIDCGVAKDSYITRDLNACNYYAQEVRTYLAEETAYKLYSNSEIKSWWNALERTDEKDDEETVPELYSSVRFLNSWDAENQIAYFGESDVIGCQVTEDTDISFLENVDSYIGQYVFVESKTCTDGMIAPDILISMKPVESSLGVLQDFTAETITINETVWKLGKDIGLLFMDMNTEVIYHVCDDIVVGIDIPQTTNGAFTGWETSTRELSVLTDSPRIFVVNQNIDSLIIEQLNNSDIFTSLILIHDGNNIVYRVDIEEETKQSGYSMKAYSVNQDLTVGVGNNIEILCSLYYEDEIVNNWDKPVFSVSNSDVMEVVACEKLESGYELTLKAIAQGFSALTITYGNSGAKVAVSVNVLLNEGTPYSYMINDVPRFYPSIWGDRETQTNVYDCNGLYVNNFPTELMKVDDNYVIEFDVYNSLYMNGSVDVYNKAGEWIKSYCIDKHTSVQGIWDTAKSAYFLVADLAKLNSLSYTAHSFSKHTHVEISVPEGGYFTIGASYVKCPGTFLYNTIDYMLFAAKKAVGDVIGDESSKQIYEATLEEVLSSQAFANEFFSKFSDIALNISSVTITGGYGNLAGAITEHAGELFKKINLDFWGIVAMCCGLGEEVFVSMTPAFVGATLKLMFSFSTLCDMTGQTVQIANSVNKPYITMYTPQATGNLTISGVTVCPDEGSVSEQAVAQVFRIANRDALIISETGLVDVYEEYNISIIENGSKIQPNGNVTIKIPVPDSYVNNECIVLHQQEDGAWQIVDSEIINGFIVFSVDHFSCFAVAQLPLDMGKCADMVYWKVDRKGTLVIGGYGAMNDYYSQKDTPWYEYRDQIKTIKVKNGIEYIGKRSFADFDIVDTVEISNTVYEIGQAAFAFSDSITKITLPDSIEIIGDAAFQDCTNLSKINIPQNVTDIGYSAFRNSILKEVELPENLKKIDISTFYGCAQLSKVVLPSTLETISSSAFYGCTSLKSIVIPENVKVIGSDVFSYCTNLLSIKLPSSLCYIESGLFEGCESLNKIVLPDTIEYIGYGSFSGCRSLEKLILPENLTQIDEYAFESCECLKEIVIPEDVVLVGDCVFMSCNNLSKVTFLGNAPTFSFQTFLWNDFAVYYPNNSTWTENVRADYGGEVTWIPMCENHIEENTVGWSATCELNGLTDGQKCAECGYIFVKQKMIPATGHRFGEYISNSNGTQIRYCENCGASEIIGTTNVNRIENLVTRVSGSTRYETSYKIADVLKQKLGIDKFDAVIIATGKNFADALAGSYLAVEKNAAILLTNGKADNIAQLHEYIKTNVVANGMVYILGGEGAVPASVENISGYTVKRLAGSSRYDTNIEILTEAGITGDEILVATGKSFADSLSASAAKLPILLVKPNGTLNHAQKSILANMNKIYIVGGDGAVSKAYEAELNNYGTVERVFGKSRYETSVAIANMFFGDVESVVVASGKNFPDGLCGGPLAAAMNAPLILTKDGGVEFAAEYVTDNGITSGYVLGGTGALSNQSVVDAFGLTSSEQILGK